MAGVFISYRREDSPGHAGRVFDRVRARFGADTVFMDVTAIDAGVDFVDAIDRAVGNCDVLLAVIGPEWASAADDSGRRRLDSPTDFVRLEIAGALKRDVRVVPLLVGGGMLPRAADLPENLQPLLRRQAVELRDASWDADIARLIASLERIVSSDSGGMRLEAPPRGRLRTIAAAAAILVVVASAALFGPRACDTPSGTAVNDGATPPVAATPSAAASATPKPDSPPAAVGASDAANPPATVVTAPNVVGRSLSEAREVLRRAGIEVARVIYRDDATKPADLVVFQSNVRTSAGSQPALALTAVARAAVVIRHRPEDAEVARGLIGALLASPAGAGLAIRTVQTPIVRPESASRVTYSDEDVAAAAVAVAKDANAWLRQARPERTLLSVVRYPPVVRRTIVLGLPDIAGAASATPLPDVRGLTLAAARRTLSAAGVTAFDYKWIDDPGRKPLEVFDQAEMTGQTGGRMAVLQVGAKGTVSVYHVADDTPIAERFARDLRSHLNVYGVIVRLVRQPALRPETVGTVASADAALAREASTIATFTSAWFAKELGRPTRIEAVTQATVGPRRLTLGLPSPK